MAEREVEGGIRAQGSLFKEILVCRSLQFQLQKNFQMSQQNIKGRPTYQQVQPAPLSPTHMELHYFYDILFKLVYVLWWG